MTDSKEAFNAFVSKQSKKLFSYLVTPESYLLVAGLLSGMVAIPLVALDIMAIHCLVTSCSALQDESNTLGSWLFFECLVLFFVGTSVVTIAKYIQISRDRNGDR